MPGQVAIGEGIRAFQRTNGSMKTFLENCMWTVVWNLVLLNVLRKFFDRNRRGGKTVEHFLDPIPPPAPRVENDWLLISFVKETQNSKVFKSL